MITKNKLTRLVSGAIVSTIDAHGPITRGTAASAAKRIVGQVFGYLGIMKEQKVKLRKKATRPSAQEVDDAN